MSLRVALKLSLAQQHSDSVQNAPGSLARIPESRACLMYCTSAHTVQVQVRLEEPRSDPNCREGGSVAGAVESSEPYSRVLENFRACNGK
jgi:hypothetical protein